MTKTEGIYVGAQAGRTTGPVPIQWRTDAITVLGTRIGNDLRHQWERQLKKLETKCEAWKNRRITMRGKAVLIRTYAVAAIIYLASVFPAPNDVLSKAERICFRFLWSDRNELVARATCHLHPSEGGLGIPNLRTISTVSIVKCIRTIVQRRHTATWTYYARYWTGFTLGTLKAEWTWLRSNLAPHGDPCHTPPWYEELMKFCHQHRQNILQTPDHHLTSRRLRSWTLTPHHPRCETEWRRYVGTPLKFPEIWHHLWSSEADNQGKEFL
jgi:hypothetical protein